MKFASKVIHAGISPDPQTGSVITPIYQTSTFQQQAPGVHKGYEYSRAQNPTREVLENALAALENATYSLTYASGLAAEDAILRLLVPGDEVITATDLYGGTYRLFTRFYAPLGIKFHFIDLNDHPKLQSLITAKTKLIWLESPSNPLLAINDIKAIAGLKEATPFGSNIKLVVDNTFATPYNQQPLDLGADIVLHSITKYLGGHSDVIMGCIMLNDAVIYEKLRFIQFAVGAVPGPLDCFLTLRGIKTLDVRMERHAQNAVIVADFLANHPKVAQVYYPGLSSHPNHEVAKRQMKTYGGMVSFYTKADSLEDASAVATNLKLFTLAESLGGVESLINHPATMTHASIPEEERLKSGLRNSLLRLSVGIEDADDLVQDLKTALQAAK